MYETVAYATNFRGDEMPFIMKKLNNISRLQSIFRGESLEVEGLCASHHAFVFVICRLSGCTQERIAQELCLDKSTVARALAHLEKHGFITRLPNEKDKRELQVFPTDKMLVILSQVKAVSKRWNELICEEISEQDMEQFLSVLKRIEARAKTVVEDMRGNEK